MSDKMCKLTKKGKLTKELLNSEDAKFICSKCKLPADKKKKLCHPKKKSKK